MLVKWSSNPVFLSFLLLPYKILETSEWFWYRCVRVSMISIYRMRRHRVVSQAPHLQCRSREPICLSQRSSFSLITWPTLSSLVPMCFLSRFSPIIIPLGFFLQEKVCSGRIECVRLFDKMFLYVVSHFSWLLSFQVLIIQTFILHLLCSLMLCEKQASSTNAGTMETVSWFLYIAWIMDLFILLFSMDSITLL